MRIHSIAVMVCLAFAVWGCVNLGGTSDPPVFYQLEYDSPSAMCGTGFKEAVRVWPFSASAPFEREEMVLAENSTVVGLSRANLWVAAPGRMITDHLIQDLGISELFTRTMSSSDPFMASLNIGGRIHKCTWVQSGENGHAVLELSVDLWRDLPNRRVLLRRRYTLESEPVAGRGPGDFAATLSALTRDFSEQLQSDLCAVSADTPIPDDGL